jgi:uncharacterized protein
MSKSYALITGASCGLGKAFAYELAEQKYNLLLVALPGESLSSLACELSLLGVDVQYYETDLTHRENVLCMTEWVNNGFSVSVLINNAGIGGSKRFADAEPDYLNNIIQLNVMSTALITRALLPNLMKQKQSYILNVSSMAAFSPMGFKTVYPASKAFIHHFSRGLYQELKDTNIFVSVVNPGPMTTNADTCARINRQGILARFSVMSPERVAKISIRQLFKKDSMIMLNWANGIQWLLMKLIPIWLRLPLLTKVIEREVNMNRRTMAKA